MQKPLSIAEHLHVEELERRSRQATDGVARRQWQILWLLAGGQSTVLPAATAVGAGPSLPAPYSPELQPAERLWPLTNEALVNRPFPDLEELEAVQVERCRPLLAQPEVIGRASRFHWWPNPRAQRPVA